MHKGEIFKALRKIRGYESKEEFSKVSGLSVEEITDVENTSKPAFNRFFIWLEVSKDFVDNLYSIVNEMNIDESELVDLIKKQLTPELDEKMKTRARDMKVVFAIMHINFCSMAEFADKLQCSPVLIKALLCLDRNLSRKMLDKVAQLINIKGYELLSLISEKWSSHYDVLIAIAQLCKNKK